MTKTLINTELLMFLVCLIFLISCDNVLSEKKTVATGNIVKYNVSLKNDNSNFNDTTVIIENRKVILKFSKSKNIIGSAVLLPGWNFSSDDWCNKTSICGKLLNKGYNLVLPDMAKSVYSTKYFKETRADWRKFPTRKWLTDTVFVQLQKKYNLLLTNQKNAIIGLSTGARGVALVILACPELFSYAAALSGDYDQRKMPNDNLMKGYYGEYSEFKNRWEGADNVFLRVKEINIPIYLGHGRNDKVVSCEQTKLLYKELVKVNPNLKVKLSMPMAGHDYKYWDSEVDSIISFFETIK